MRKLILKIHQAKCKKKETLPVKTVLSQIAKIKTETKYIMQNEVQTFSNTVWILRFWAK